MLKHTTPPPHCTHIYCLVPINIQKAPMNIKECNFLYMEAFNDTLLLHSLFHSRCHFVRLPVCCPITQQHVTGYWWEGPTYTAIPPTSASEVMGQHNKIGGITFGAALIITKDHFLCPAQPSLLLHLPMRTDLQLSQQSVRHMWQSFSKAQPLFQWSLPEFSPSEKMFL